MAQCGKVECMANAVPQDSEDEEAQGFREEEEARRGSRCLRCYALKIVFAAFILTILCGRKGKGLHGSVLEIFEGTGDRDPPSLPGLLQAGRQGGAEGPAETAEPTSTHTPEDREQWQNWIQEIRETIKKQKTRRDEQAQKLQEELAAWKRRKKSWEWASPTMTRTLSRWKIWTPIKVKDQEKFDKEKDVGSNKKLAAMRRRWRRNTDRNSRWPATRPINPCSAPIISSWRR